MQQPSSFTTSTCVMRLVRHDSCQLLMSWSVSCQVPDFRPPHSTLTFSTTHFKGRWEVTRTMQYGCHCCTSLAFSFKHTSCTMLAQIVWPSSADSRLPKLMLFGQAAGKSVMGSLGLSGMMFCYLISTNSSRTTTVVMLKTGLSGKSWFASHAPDKVCAEIVIVISATVL